MQGHFPNNVPLPQLQLPSPRIPSLPRSLRAPLRQVSHYTRFTCLNLIETRRPPVVVPLSSGLLVAVYYVLRVDKELHLQTCTHVQIRNWA